jgi:two-component system, OmpR family, KDP operon response regulator KdpE
MTRVLVVDDEPQIRRALELNLRVRDYEVTTAASGEEALRLAASVHPDLIILDLGLPGIDGVEVIDGIRGWSDTPILILSAREREEAKVAALDAGADDYVTKPFGMDELLARVRVLERRRAADDEPPPLVRTDDFTIDLAARRVVDRRGMAVRLTPIEWRIVETLVRHPGWLVSQPQLLTAVWGPGYEHETNYLRVHLSHIRHKLEPDPSRPRYFHTEPGMGYRYDPPAAMSPGAPDDPPRDVAVDG